jgi:hypothetical protein
MNTQQQTWRERIVPEPDNEARTCPDCGTTWILTARSRAWFEAKRLLVPRRCEPCRRIRRSQETAR